MSMAKAELFVAALDQAAQDAAAGFAAMLGQVDDATAVLSLLLDPDHFAQLHAESGLGALFADAASTTDRRIIAAVGRTMSRFAAPLTELLAQGQREGACGVTSHRPPSPGSSCR